MARPSRRARGAARAARAARAQVRQAADLIGPLSDEQMIEAEGYLVAAIEAKIEQFGAVVDDMRARLAAMTAPYPIGLAAPGEADGVRDEITHARDALAELEAMLDAVRCRRNVSAPSALALMTIRGASRALLAEAQRLGVPVNAQALAEAMRRENLIGRWLMSLPDAEAPPRV